MPELGSLWGGVGADTAEPGTVGREAVDAAEGDRLLKLFRSLNRLGATVLIASHDERVAADSGATVLRLDGGRLAGGAA